MSSRNRNLLLIGILALIGIVIVLSIGIGKIIGTVITCTIVGLIIGTLIAGVDGFFSVIVLKRATGLWVYKSSPSTRFISAVAIAALLFLKDLSMYTLVLDAAMLFVWATTLLIGFLLGSLLFANRESIAQTAEGIRTGNVDLAATARGAASAMKDTVKTGLNESAAGAKRVSDQLSGTLH